MKKILATTGLCVSFASIANATDITNYADLYNNASSGGNFTILNNIGANNSLGSIVLNGVTTTLNGVNLTTIFSQGDMSLDYPLIWLDNGATLNLNNMTFAGMGGIFTIDMNTVDINVDNVIFKDNNYTYGGSIRGNVLSIYGDETNIKNSVFSNNSLTAQSAYGSAMYLQNKNTMVENTIFANNSTISNGSSSRTAGGGAIYNVMAIDTDDNNIPDSGKMSIKNSSFDGNSVIATGQARARGGAVYTGEGTVLTLTDTNFTNNLAQGLNTTLGNVAGGAIYANKATVNINAENQNVVFNNNKVNSFFNDIYTTSDSILNLNANLGHSISFGGSLDSEGKSSMNITGPGTIVFDDKVSNFDMAIKGGVVQLGKTGTTTSKTYLDNVVLDFGGASNNTILSSYKGAIDSIVGNVQIKNANNIGLYLDVNESSADQYNIIADSDGTFNLAGVNIVSDFSGNKTYDIFKGAFNLPSINNNEIIIATNTSVYKAMGNTDNTITIAEQTPPPPSSNPLNNAITSSICSFSMTDNLAMDENISALQDNLTVYGNGKTLSADGTKLGFYTNGPSLTLLNIGNMSGFTSEMNSFHSSGGAIENEGGTLTVYNSSFSENHVSTATSITGNAMGGAVFNSGDEQSLISGSTFSKNLVVADENSKYALGGAIYNATSSLGSLTINNSNFTENLSYSTAGASGAISEAFGGAIINDDDSKLSISNSQFSKNLVYTTSINNADSFGGAIYNGKAGKIDISNTIFNENQAQHSGQEYAAGGAISNGSNGILPSDGGEINITNSLFDSNKVGGLPSGADSKYAYGAAIFNNATLNITDSSFINNTASGLNARGGAIFSTKSLEIAAINQNVIFANNLTNDKLNDIYAEGTVNIKGGMNTYLNGGITGTANITKTGAGALILGGDNSFANLNINEGILFAKNINSLSGNLNFANNTIFNLLNNQIYDHSLDLNLAGATTLALDADVKTMQMDKITANSLSGGGNFNVSTINILNKTNQQNFSLDFANDTLKNNVIFTNTKMDISNVYKPYDVSYNNATGKFDFGRGGGYNSIKPQIMAGPAALIAGNYTNQLNIYNQALDISPEKASVWVKNWTDNDTIDFNNGPNVDNDSYGIMLGANNEHYGAFVAYNAGEQKYDGVKVKQNGGAVGLSAMTRDNNWWNKGTFVVGFSRAESNNDSWNMFNSGVAVQSGYDINTAVGVIAPNITASYSYLYAEDYSDNIDIKGGNTQAIQLKPGIKWGSPKDWDYRPYVYINGVWTFADNKAFVADAETLPTFRLDPYVEYGTGIETSLEDWSANFGVSGYSFGRKGINFNLGIQYNF